MTDLLRIGLVACCGPKLAGPAPAEVLYVSPLFKKARIVASRQPGGWFILSALHGLVDPTEVIDPYNYTLTGQPKAVKAAWGRKVFEQIKGRGLEACLFVVYAGANYAEPLAPFLALERPLKGLGIGQQLAWLTRAAASGGG